MTSAPRDPLLLSQRQRLGRNPQPPAPSPKPPFFYGWVIVAVAWICYGFGISPAYYSWGNFAPAIVADLGFDRADVGGIFGLFTFVYMSMGAVVGLTQARFGIRPVMTAGFVLAAVGLWRLSHAQSTVDCYLAYSLMAGAGIGFSTTVPSQTLAQNWFRRRRALALGAIFTAGGIVGGLVSRADAYLLAHYDWRTGWTAISIVSLILAVVAGVFVRDRPEQMGQRRDGDDPLAADSEIESDGDGAWTPARAVRTSAFGRVIFCSVAYAVPWAVVVAHTNLHLRDLGHPQATAASLVGLLALVSIVGRLAAGLGDRIAPQKVLAVALALEGLGVGSLLLARSDALAYLAVVLIGIGFGTAYISVPVVFSTFFGRRAFSVVAGISISVTGVFNGLGPWLTGMVYDTFGSYAVPFLALMAIDLTAAMIAARLETPSPGH